MSERKLIIIADAHLGATEGDVDDMINFISSCRPKEHQLVFLGDLFHVWAGPQKYRTEIVRALMDALFAYRRTGGESYLIAGNRDVFLPEKRSDQYNDHYPFKKIALNLLELDFAGNKVIAVHGDTINRNDKQYLRWRTLIRSKPFRWSFNLVPAKKVKKLLISLEKNLKNTNQAFRKEFPESEWNHFMQDVYRAHSPRILMAGHYHPKEMIVNHHHSMTALILPAWCDKPFYLELGENMEFTLKCCQSVPKIN